VSYQVLIAVAVQPPSSYLSSMPSFWMLRTPSQFSFANFSWNGPPSSVSFQHHSPMISALFSFTDASTVVPVARSSSAARPSRTRLISRSPRVRGAAWVLATASGDMGADIHKSPASPGYSLHLGNTEASKLV